MNKKILIGGILVVFMLFTTTISSAITLSTEEITIKNSESNNDKQVTEKMEKESLVTSPSLWPWVWTTGYDVQTPCHVYLNGKVSPFTSPENWLEAGFVLDTKYHSSWKDYSSYFDAWYWPDNHPYFWAIIFEQYLTRTETYHFRAVAKYYDGGWIQGDDISFCLANPWITTQFALDITRTSAILYAMRWGGGVDHDVWFVYDDEKHDNYQDYAYSTEHVTLPRGQMGQFYIQAKELNPGVTYYYRAVVSNDVATVAGSEKIFITNRVKCEGDLVLKGRCGSKVVGFFTVENVGPPGSTLDWKISDWPEWEEWWGGISFNPSSGKDLTPEDGPQTVIVTVEVPLPRNVWNGEICAANSKNSLDKDCVSITLTSPRSRERPNLLFFNLLEQFQNFFLLLKSVLLGS